MTANSGSTGRIAENIGKLFIDKGHESYIAYGRSSGDSKSQLIRIGSRISISLHGAYTRISDRHGFASRKATQELIKKIDIIQPDVIGLHNLHGYFLNIQILFEYLKKVETPVVWTLHDCWAFTGHCTHFDLIGCKKWKTHCNNCPLTHTYPKSYVDQSYKNFEDKRDIFNGHPNLTIVTPSHWLKSLVKKSYLRSYKIKVIHNGIDLNQFRILDKMNRNIKIDSSKKVILGIANVWGNSKGLDDFLKLSEMLSERYQIVLIGLNKKQLRQLPNNIIGFSRIDSINELVEWYNRADAFVNPSKEESFGLVTVEAMACGTPVIGYNATATPELITNETGRIIPIGNITALIDAVEVVINENSEEFSTNCRKRVENLFNQKERFMDYYQLFQKISLFT